MLSEFVQDGMAVDHFVLIFVFKRTLNKTFRGEKTALTGSIM